jgi:RNA polymerase sigma-70 factor (ECF subfamily)
MKTSRTQNESALVCAAREGDKEALNKLLTRHWTWLRALVYGVLGDALDLDDVMQEVCLRVMTRIHTLREPECFRSWLAVLARREAIKHGRGRSRRATLVNTDAVGAPPRASQEGPLERLEQKELCRRILDAVKTLPDKYLEVFMLAHAGELTYAQMAEVLDVPITTMQIRLVRARRMVQNQLIDKREQKVYER